MKESLSKTETFEASVKQRLKTASNTEHVDKKENLISLIIGMLRIHKVFRLDTESFCNHKYVNPHVSIFLVINISEHYDPSQAMLILGADHVSGRV